MSSMIREGKTHQISGLIKLGKRDGMIAMDDALQAPSSKTDTIEPLAGLEKAIDKDDFRKWLKDRGDGRARGQGVTRPRTARPLLGALATALCACSDPTPAAPDATLPRDAAADLPALPDGLAAPTTTLELRDGRAVYALAAAPLRLSVRHLDGAPWFASPPATPLIEIGTRAGGSSPTRFSDPRVHDPPDITWVSPSRVTDARTPSPDTRAVTLAGGDGDALTATLALTPQGATLTVDACATREAAMIRVNLATDDGGYHGLGERFGHVDARGEVVPMQLHLDTRVASGTNEAHVPVPFVVSTRAYGMFVETREAGAFDVGATDPSTLSRDLRRLPRDGAPLRRRLDPCG
ncbi:MAG: hypothetical protein V9G19_27750 [Tetrasphaera sp.]